MLYLCKKFSILVIVQGLLLVLVLSLSSCFTSNDVEDDEQTKYQVIFIVDGETYFQMNIFENSAIMFPINPTKNDYTFLGWYIEQNGNKQALTNEFQVKQNINAYALWDKIEDKIFKIYYGYNESLSLEPILNENFSLEVPVREGYIFKGWVNSEGVFYTNEIGESLNIWENESDLELFASWEEAYYTINFDSLGGNTLDSIKVKYNTSPIDIPSVVKEGYIFKGWYTDIELTNKYESEKVVSNLTLYALWEEIYYTISFDSLGGNTFDSIKVKYNTSPIDIPSVVREGYIFKGWYTDIELTNKYESEKVVSNLTLYALWEEIYYTISFDSLGGNTLDSIKVKYNTSPIDIPSVVKEGYIFKGWYLDIELTNKYENEKLVSDLTLYASWEEIYYTISFNSLGGNTLDSIKVKYNTLPLELSTPFKTGYLFKGWYLDIDLVNRYEYAITNEDFTLYASWEIVVYTISFDSNGGSMVDSVTTDIQNPILFLDESLKEGYEFKGWYLEKECINKYNFSDIPNGDLTLYARWEARLYTITFDSNGGSMVNSITLPYETTVSEPKSVEREGYTFNGWYSDITLKDRYTFTTMPLGDIILYAKWTNNVYSVFFEKQNAVSGSSGITAIYDMPMPFATAPYLLGYNFLGYFDLEGVKYYEADMSSAQNWDKSCNYTLIAHWEAINYTISFETNGGSEIESIVQGYETIVTKPADPKKDGYDFIGWYTDVDFLNPYSFSTMPYEGITLYAAWELAYFTISFVTDGGSLVEDIIQLYQEEIIKPLNPLKDGYYFSGWYTDKEYTNLFVFSVMPLNGATLYAKWLKGTEGLEFKEIDGGYSVFVGDATSVKNIVIPEIYNDLMVVEIGEYAFSRCTKLTSIIIPSSVTRIALSAFRDCFNLKSIAVDEFNLSYYSHDGVLYNYDKTSLIKYPCAKDNSIYQLLETTLYIEYGAFENAVNLKEIIMNEGLLEIKSWAFYNCLGLINVIVPSTVINIESEAFLFCNSLISISIPYLQNDYFGFIFGACDYLSNNKYVPFSLTTVFILSGVIADNAFYGCSNIKEIYVNESVIISENAFSNCDEDLIINVLVTEEELVE